MPPTVYRTALIALIQALKAVTQSQSISDYEYLLGALGLFLEATCPPESRALQGHIRTFVRGMPSRPHESAWPVIHEMCRDMLGLLDVPYAER